MKAAANDEFWVQRIAWLYPIVSAALLVVVTICVYGKVAPREPVRWDQLKSSPDASKTATAAMKEAANALKAAADALARRGESAPAGAGTGASAE